VARTEAIATWTEMLRDTIAAAHGLEAAIAATSAVAPAPIAREVLALSIAVEREPLPVALRRLADDLAHPIADLVVSSLSVAATGSVRDLADLLGTLAEAARDEAAMQLRVEAARARMRTAVRVITGCTVVTALGLVLLNPSYVAVYASPLGQTTLALIAICWGLALWWLARMSRFRAPERFLVVGGDSTLAAGP
jgi:Flp pilus assembly protein TadB